MSLAEQGLILGDIIRQPTPPISFTFPRQTSYAQYAKRVRLSWFSQGPTIDEQRTHLRTGSLGPRVFILLLNT